MKYVICESECVYESGCVRERGRRCVSNDICIIDSSNLQSSRPSYYDVIETQP